MPDPDSLTWTAVLRSGALLTEAECGGFLPVVEAWKAGELDSVVIEDADGQPLAQVVIRGGMRPVFGRLWRHTLSFDGEDKGRALRAVVYGWQSTIKGTNVRALTWITNHGVFVADRDLDEIEAEG